MHYPYKAILEIEGVYEFVGEDQKKDVSLRNVKSALKALQEGRLTAKLVYNLPGSKEDRLQTRKIALGAVKEAKQCGATLLPAVHEMVRKASSAGTSSQKGSA